MKLKINAMTLDGMAFLVDLETNIEYYMHKIGEDIQPLADCHYALDYMNLQNYVPAPDEAYRNMVFSSLKDASKFISKTGIEWRIKDTENWDPESANGKKIKEESLVDYTKELKKYQ